MHLPPSVTKHEWERANAALIRKEKLATRHRDRLAAVRRRQPMTEIPPGYLFEGSEGTVELVDLFDERSQLVMYHFMFPAGGDPCDGCSMFVDQVGHLAHLHARDTTVVLVSPASQAELREHAARMSWDIPWYTTVGDGFQADRGTGGGFRLDVYLCHEGRTYLTYSTSGRGVEQLGSVWTFLDLTPFGRQELWEDTPPGRPQTPPYEWWRFHDEYDDASTGTRS